MGFERAWTGAPWEVAFGYCRAVRAGEHVFVGGTAPIDDSGAVVAPGDAHAQTIRCYTVIDRALAKLGVDKRIITRVRLFVTDIGRAEEFGRAHKEFFEGHLPCMTMVEVRRLIDPDMLVEIEAEGMVL